MISGSGGHDFGSTPFEGAGARLSMPKSACNEGTENAAHDERRAEPLGKEVNF
jgi:hypothetical protein